MKCVINEWESAALDHRFSIRSRAVNMIMVLIVSMSVLVHVVSRHCLSIRIMTIRE